jgi:hypothetical protein
MTESEERPHFSSAYCNNQLITVIEKSREELKKRNRGGVTFERSPEKPRDLGEILRAELYVDGIYLDGAGI